jgi:molybdopterin-guanine dinucleotide biosynthesis protein A
MSNNSISCIILAGGEAKRFNREDKGLIDLNEKPLIAHVIADQLENFQGPLAGIAAALPYCKHKRVLVVPCDIPLLPNDLVEKLATDNANSLHIVKSGDRLQLVFLMHQDLLPSLNNYLEQGHQKVMDWVDMQNPAIIEFDDAANAFANLNTFNELKQLSD